MSYKITDTIIVDNNKNIASIGTALFAGPVIIGGGTSTGTVSQPLQVTGTNGAYIGGNLGIGSTNPSSKLWVSGDIYNTGIHTAQVLNASKDPGTGIATDFTNSLFGNGWRVSAPGSTTYYKLATLPPGGGGNTFDHLIINGVLGAWTNGNQTPFEITFSNRGTFNYKYVSYGSVRSDVRIIGISTNSSVEIWAQHQASQFTKLVYNIPNSIESIVVSNPTSTTTAPTGTTVFDSSTATPRFIINESDYVGIGTATPQSALDVRGTISIGRTDTTTVNSIRSVTDINSWEYAGVNLSVSGSGAGQDTSPQDIYFKDDGTKMFYLGNSGTDVNEYALSTAWEVNTAGFTTSFLVNSQESGPLGLYFKPDGSRMYICGSVAASPFGADQVRSYTLSTPWSVAAGNVTYDSKAYTISDSGPQAVYFKDDGTKMYVVGSSADAVYEYSLSIAWELDSTITLLNTLLIGTGNTLNLPLTLIVPTGINFNTSGTKMYITDSTRDVVARFDLSTPWDTTTISFYDNVYVGFQELAPAGIFYQEDQSKAYIVGSSSDTVFQYNTDVPSLELASSGISTRSSVIINNEARLNNRLYVTGDTHINGNTTIKGALTIDSSISVGNDITIADDLTVSGGTITAGNVATTLLGGNTTTGVNLADAQTSGAFILGGTLQTGTITLGRATTSQTTNIQAGVSLASTTKTINFGTGGLSGSFTQINIGPTAGVGTITVNSGTTLSVSNQIISTQANSTTTGGGQIYLNGATGNRIDFNTNGVGAPTFTTRSAGTKLVLYPNIGGSTVDYALGIEDGTLWNSVASSARQFKWYAGITTVATLKGTGEFLLGSSTLTGTASQLLQVTGGAYVSGNLGIGTTNPQNTLDVGVGTIRLINKSSTGRFSQIYQDNELIFSNSSTNDDFSWTNGSGSRMRLYGAGNLVIPGTFTPTGTASQRLQVDGGAYVSGNLGVGNTNGEGIKLFVSQGNPAANRSVALITDDGTIPTMTSGATLRISNDGSGNTFALLEAESNAGRLVFTNAGNLGIGTTNPSNRLTINGSISDTTPILALLSGNSASSFNNGAQIAFGYDGTTNYQHFIQTRHNSANSSNAIDFYVSDGTQNNALTSGSLHTMSLVSGSVGINTTNPGATLNVVPTESSIAGLFSGTTSSDMVRITQLGTGNALVVEDETPEGSPFVVTGLGTVGIGITNPTIKLTVNGGLDSSNRQVRFVNPGSGDLYIKHANLVSSIEAGSSVQLALSGNGAEVVRINSTGVGIGTTNPQNTLDVGVGTIRLINKSSTGRFSQIYQDGALNFKNSNGGDDFNFFVGGTTLMKLYGSGPLGINTTSLTGTSSQLLQVNSGGYFNGLVGIGTTNPEKLLHLSTSVATPLIIQRTSNNNSAVEYRNTVSSMWAGIGGSANGWGVASSADVGVDAHILVTRNSGELLVGTTTLTGTASQKLQVNSGAYVSGSVGIGTTNPTEKLQVQGNLSINGTTSYGSTTATTATVSQIGIHSGISTSTYRSVEYTIQATQDTNFHATKILSIHNGTTAYNSEYGTIYNNTSVGTFDVDVSGGNIRLLVTPASSSSTTYTINFVATKI